MNFVRYGGAGGKGGGSDSSQKLEEAPMLSSRKGNDSDAVQSGFAFSGAGSQASFPELKVCFVIAGGKRKLFAGNGCSPGVRQTAAFCQTDGHEVTILLADAEGEADTRELRSWREQGFEAHSLAVESVERESFYPNLLRNSWLTYRWLRQRDFDRIFFGDDSSAGLMSFAAKRLGEAFYTSRLIYHLNGPANWGANLRDRRQLIQDDVTLPYSVQYGVENADQLIVPVDYFLGRIRNAGWIPAGRVSVLPYLAAVAKAKSDASAELAYLLHDSDHAYLAGFLRALSFLATQGKKVRVSFVYFGDRREQRILSNRLHRLMEGADVTDIPYEIVDGAARLPIGALWLFSPLWLNLPFLILKAANRGEALLVAGTVESREWAGDGNWVVDWTPTALSTRIARCLEGDRPHARGISREVAEKAWREAILDLEPETPEPVENLDGIRVSVCVAHFNKARDFREALESLRAQTHRNLEVIVVDDASTDPAARAEFDSVATAFASPDWKFIREEANRGPGHARNRAASLASGSHLVFFDADDVAFPDMIERLLRGLLRSKGDCVAGSSRRLREVDGRRVIEGTFTYVGGSLENAFLNPPAGAVFIVSKETFDAVGGFKTDLPRDCHEDWNFHVRLLAREYRLHVLPEPVFAYRNAPLSRSLLVPHDMALLVEPLLEGTARMRKNLLNLAIERAGAMESATQLLADYEQFAGGIRFLRILNRLKRSVLRLVAPRRKE